MKKILVALDGSEREPAVLRAAVELASKTEARLVLLRAVTVPMELPQAAFSSRPDEVLTMIESAARHALEARAAEVKHELVDKVRVELGSPWRAICEAAREEKADLIVIGSHGYGGLDRLLGTTAAKVVNHADHSVLVVKG